MIHSFPWLHLYTQNFAPEWIFALPEEVLALFIKLGHCSHSPAHSQLQVTEIGAHPWVLSSGTHTGVNSASPMWCHLFGAFQGPSAAGGLLQGRESWAVLVLN